MSRVSETELPVAPRAKSRPGLFSYLLHHPSQFPTAVISMCVHEGRVRTYVWACMRVHASAHKTQRLIYSMCSLTCPCHIFWSTLPLNLELPDWLACLSSKLQGASYHHLPPNAGIARSHCCACVPTQDVGIQTQVLRLI